jgi:hypothetical protein
MRDIEQTIRERAYKMWIDGGRQEGHAVSHWLAAQHEILGELRTRELGSSFTRRTGIQSFRSRVARRRADANRRTPIESNIAEARD